MGESKEAITIDLFLTGSKGEDSKRAAVLTKSSNVQAKESGNALIAAINQELPQGWYKAEKRSDVWYFIRQQELSYL